MVGIPITASVDDPDGGVTDITWQWYGGPIILASSETVLKSTRTDARRE